MPSEGRNSIANREEDIDIMAVVPMTLEEIARRDTGGMGRQIVASFDVTGDAGQRQLAIHMEHDQAPTSKVNDGWYGTTFVCVGIVSRGVLAKKNSDGTMLSQPKPLVRTTFQTDDGRMLALSSSYVFEDVMNIRVQFPIIDREHPITLKLKKCGNSDRIVRVWEPIDQFIGSTGKPKQNTTKG